MLLIAGEKKQAERTLTEDPYSAFKQDLSKQNNIRLNDDEIRSRIDLIRHPLTSPADRTKAREEICQSFLGLIPWVIDRFLPRHFSANKAELVGGLFEVINACIERFDPNHIGRSGGKVKFISFVAGSLIKQIRHVEPRIVFNSEIPFYISIGLRNQLGIVERCLDQLWQQLEREPTDAELAVELKRSTDGKIDFPENKLRAIRTRLMEESVPMDKVIYGSVDPDDLWPEEIRITEEVADTREKATVDQVEGLFLREAMEDVVDLLSYHQRLVLRRRFGLDDGEERTLEEIGDELGYTREGVRQIEAKALRHLRHPSITNKIKDFLE